MKITTNNVPRDIIDANELTEKEQKEFDYYDWSEFHTVEASFVRYKGRVYDLGEFQHTGNIGDALAGWEGYDADTYFSGTVVKYVEDGEQVVMGRYYT